MALINTDSLMRELIKYQKDMIELPFTVLLPVLEALRMSLLDNVLGKDVVIVKERAAGIAGPYDPNKTLLYRKELARMSERKLEVERCYAVLKEDVTRYGNTQVLYDAEKNRVDNKSKKHPLEIEIIKTVLTIVAEDIVDALFFAKRDVNDPTPLGMVDGIYTLQDALVTAGAVSEALGNLLPCGSLAAPANGTDITAYKSMRDWLRATDQKIKNKPLVLLAPLQVLTNAKDALENKRSGYSDTNYNTLLDALRTDCNLPQLQFGTHYCLGTGTRLTLTTPGNFDIGFNMLSDINFMQIRQPYENANLTQFWIQWEMGERIKNFHKRGFMISDGTTVSNEMSGDYIAGSGSGNGLIGV